MLDKKGISHPGPVLELVVTDENFAVRGFNELNVMSYLTRRGVKETTEKRKKLRRDIRKLGRWHPLLVSPVDVNAFYIETTSVKGKEIKK